MTHNEFAEEVCARLCAAVTFDVNDVRDAIHMALQNVTLTEECRELATVDADKRATQLRRWIACKMVEGCTPKTLKGYADAMKMFMRYMPKPFEQITPDDLRYYLALRSTKDKIGKVTLNNDRLRLSSFFAWATANDVIVKNPMLPVKKIKSEKRVKKPFSDEEQEMLRIGAQGDIRLTAMLEVFLSTGVRVGELVEMKLPDINGDEILVFGKGQKERIVYLNARSRVALKMYLDTRDDDNESVFVAEAKPHKRLEISGVEIVIRELGKKAGVLDTHPHRFRRTAATMALRRGMPIEQVQKMLGHENISTTLIYAKMADDTVKQTHRRLM